MFRDSGFYFARYFVKPLFSDLIVSQDLRDIISSPKPLKPKPKYVLVSRAVLRWVWGVLHFTAIVIHQNDPEHSAWGRLGVIGVRALARKRGGVCFKSQLIRYWYSKEYDKNLSLAWELFVPLLGCWEREDLTFRIFAEQGDDLPLRLAFGFLTL